MTAILTLECESKSFRFYFCLVKAVASYPLQKVALETKNGKS